MSFIWDKLPAYIKYPIMAALFLIWTPIRVYNGAKNFIHSEVHAYITPLKEVRDYEILTMKTDISGIKEDTREIRKYLMGESRQTSQIQREK